MDDQQFRRLLDRSGLSWEGYRKVRKGVKKRLHRHMQTLGCKTVEAYLKRIFESRELMDRQELLMTVSISRFFRDLSLWETLQKEVFPELVSRHPERLRFWSAGCACGEEVYSLKIVWEEWGSQRPTVPCLEMVATDINPGYLDKAMEGRYPLSSLREVPDSVRTRYLEELPDKGTFVVKSHLKREIQWKIHHLLADAPGSGFHLVFLRNNVLTYYIEPLKEAVLSRVLKAMVHGGLLVIGSHEKIPGPFGSHVKPYRGHRWIFQID